MVFICTVIVLYLIVVGIPVLSYCRLIRNPRLALYLTRVLDGIVMFLAGIRHEAIGMEKVAGRTGGCVYVGNHRSFVDPFVPFWYLPGEMSFLVKAEVFRVPLLSFALRTMRMISVDRSNRDAAVASIDRAVSEISSGRCVVLFPEGTRNRQTEMLPFKKGAFVLAIKAQVDIVPFTLFGSDHVLKPDTLFMRPGKITMIVHDPVPTRGLTLEDREELLTKVRASIERSWIENRNELAATTETQRHRHTE